MVVEGGIETVEAPARGGVMTGIATGIEDETTGEMIEVEVRTMS